MFDLKGWAGRTLDLMNRTIKLVGVVAGPDEDLEAPQVRAVRAEGLRLALELVDAIGSYDAANAVYAGFQSSIGAALAVRYREEVVANDVSIRLAQLRYGDTATVTALWGSEAEQEAKARALVERQVDSVREVSLGLLAEPAE